MIELQLKKNRHLKELEEIYQNIEPESIKNIVNKDDSKFSLVWLYYIYNQK